MLNHSLSHYKFYDTSYHFLENLEENYFLLYSESITYNFIDHFTLIIRKKES